MDTREGTDAQADEPGEADEMWVDVDLLVPEARRARSVAAAQAPGDADAGLPFRVPRDHCAMCRARGKTWRGSDPACAFRTGRFTPENWNCATVAAIRNIVRTWDDSQPKGVAHIEADHQNYAMIHVEEDEQAAAWVLWLSWYKRRGRTEAMWLLDANAPPVAPTEADCLRVLARYRPEAAAGGSDGVT